MIPSINPLVLNLKESATLSINKMVRQLRREGQEVYHFGFGQAPFPTPAIIQEALRRNAHRNEYLPTEGLPELRDTVSAFYTNEFGLDYRPGDVFVGPGSKELIFQVSYLVEGSLLVPTPSWVSYGPQATIRGKRLIPITTERDSGYKLTASELDKACHKLGQQQKMLILNNPNNPTGGVYREEELREIAQICRAYNILAISDEIYAMIDFSGKPHASLSKYYPEGTIVSGGLSKSFAAGGYRLGVMLIPEEMRVIKDALNSVISETFSAVSAPVQYAALEAYSRFDEIRDEIAANNEVYHFASRYLCGRFRDMELNCPKPEGAFYLFPDFENYAPQLREKGILTGIELTARILREKGVAFLPGSDFYFPATNLGVRVAAVDFDGAQVRDRWPGRRAITEEETLKLFPRLVKGCDRLAEFLDELQPGKFPVSTDTISTGASGNST
jgi:aspartate/methionine/tyrosine aminotransferase